MACFALDPATGDLKIAAGAFVTHPTAATALYVQLQSDYAKWPGDPSSGSRLRDLRAIQANPVPLVETEARRALGVLQLARMIADVKVRAVELSTGRIALYTECRDTASGQLVSNYAEVRR